VRQGGRGQREGGAGLSGKSEGPRPVAGASFFVTSAWAGVPYAGSEEWGGTHRLLPRGPRPKAGVTESGAVAANAPVADIGISTGAWHSKPMVDTYALFQIGDAAEEAGNFAHARAAFERGAALGDVACLSRLAYLFDTGTGVEVDKTTAMRLYQRAWRMDRDIVAGSNIAILYRERRQWQLMFRWWKRLAATGDGSAQLEMAKCYLRGRGVKRDPQAALRCLAAAEGSAYITECERDLARRLLGKLRPRVVDISAT
jgi:uncharacterized protein